MENKDKVRQTRVLDILFHFFKTSALQRDTVLLEIFVKTYY